jgi:hypothetical protein
LPFAVMKEFSTRSTLTGLSAGLGGRNRGDMGDLTLLVFFMQDRVSGTFSVFVRTIREITKG